MAEVIGIAQELGAHRVGGPLSRQESELFSRYRNVKFRPDINVDALRQEIRGGADPLGESWQRYLSPRRRANLGAVYTPHHIVQAMLQWIARRKPVRVVDMGCGSGRFCLEAARHLPRATIVAIDTDPVATIITRACLAARGCSRARVINDDYLDIHLTPARGPTAFVGNPPYVRHQRLTRTHKDKATAMARGLGYKLSRLSGLHMHFLIATAAKAASGDIGCVILNAEWMQIAYGHALRALLVERLGLETLHLLDPRAMVFPGVMSTAVIVGFRVGARRRSVATIAHTDPLTFGRANGSAQHVPLSRFGTSRWSFILGLNGSTTKALTAVSHVPLGSFCRVHRGIATGANDFFVMTPERAKARGLLPWVRPVLTRARELQQSNGVARMVAKTRVLLCPPRDIDLASETCRSLRAYLASGRRHRFHRRYLCEHRHPWWYLGNIKPAPIIATYMARRPLRFALNPRGLLILNVFHGLYPCNRIGASIHRAIVAYLNEHSAQFRPEGRVHQGGLWKFEPHDLESVKVRPIARLAATK